MCESKCFADWLFYLTVAQPIHLYLLLLTLLSFELAGWMNIFVSCFRNFDLCGRESANKRLNSVIAHDIVNTNGNDVPKL